jgi:hypothetical protein
MSLLEGSDMPNIRRFLSKQTSPDTAEHIAPNGWGSE